MSDIRQVVNGVVVQPEESKPIGERAEGMDFAPLDMDLQAVAQVMGLDGDADKAKYTSEMKTLIAWARTQTEERDPVHLKWVLRNLQMKLGSPPLSEKMITRAARYAYLDMETKKNEAEKLSLME